MTAGPAAPDLADLVARVAAQDDRIGRLEATLRALARLPADAPGRPADLTDTTPTGPAAKTAVVPAPAPRPVVHRPPGPTPDLVRAAVDLVPEAVVGVDAGGVVRVWNRAAEGLFGWPAAEAVGRPPRFVPADKADEHAGLLIRAQADGRVRGVATVRRRKDGALVPVRAAVDPSRCGGAVFTFRDPDATSEVVPHHPAAKASAPAEAGRFATLGRALTGVAHDFNNLLTVIQGHVELLAEGAAPDWPGREAAATIKATAELAAGVVGHLLAVAGPDPESPPRTDVNVLVGRLDRVVKAVAGAGVKVAVALGAGVGPAAVHPAELTQVLLNLATNARDAMPAGGTLIVRTAAAGEYVAVTVADTGAGMDPATVERAFDPFFTTKPGGGHGVGLATVREIVARAGGHVEVESEPGWGTQVRVLFRRA